ncbi:Bactericidal permeability-increasing protein, alpha/beta domain [Sarocladium implicatum]|nr:Bactericidal permeability-increasing protein, alpha/beta domain [Sarocladium implicatum]
MSLFGLGQPSGRDAEREPLLPRYNDDTTLQTRLHEKLHTYQMLRALGHGYMPSNEQTIVHLRSLLSADVLNPNVPDLSDSGRALVRSVKLWIQQFIAFLQHKNNDDQIQDLIWCLTQARLHVDVADIERRASKAKVKADAQATYRSLQTVGSLLLSNADFRVFLSDLTTVGKEIFRDTAFTLADVSKDAGKQLDEEIDLTAEQANGETRDVPSADALKDKAGDITEVVAHGASEVVQEAEQSVAEHFTGEERQVLVRRLKQAIFSLRGRTDYSESVSTLALLIQRYLLIYSQVAAEAVEAAEDDVHTNEEVDIAVSNFWQLVCSVGSKDAWKKVETSFQAVIEDGKSDPEFKELVKKLTQVLQDMLMDPDFFENSEQRFNELRSKAKDLTGQSSVADDVDGLITNFRAAIESVSHDSDFNKLIQTSERIAHILSPAAKYTNGELVADSINVFVPLAIQALQHLPIPRLEVSTPAIDLLVENLIIQPGRTVNNSSFLPYRLQVSTKNDVDVRKARFGMTSSLKSLMTVKISGVSVAADDLGYWLRLHSGLLRMTDQGLAGFFLDERGFDVLVDLEIGRDRIDQIVSLRRVRVRIHHLNYKLSKSKFSFFAWLLKPLVRPIVKAALEVKLANSITVALQTLNRELLFARERLRATRIANPDDLWTFVKAVASRLTPAPDPDVDARVGVEPGSGVFRGRYAPGSLVQLWEAEGRAAEQRVFEYRRDGWRNDIFDVTATPV